jgi:hypothetical protein
MAQIDAMRERACCDDIVDCCCQLRESSSESNRHVGGSYVIARPGRGNYLLPERPLRGL